MSEPTHPQVPIRVGDWEAEIDEELAPLITELWRAGWETSRSCQEHIETGYVWVEFRNPLHVEDFVRAVAPYDCGRGSLWSRATMWGFGNLGAEPIPHGDDHDTTDAWIYHTSWGLWAPEEVDEASAELELSVNVLFPRSDLAIVTERMRGFNQQASESEKGMPSA